MRMQFCGKLPYDPLRYIPLCCSHVETLIVAGGDQYSMLQMIQCYLQCHSGVVLITILCLVITFRCCELCVVMSKIALPVIRSVTAGFFTTSKVSMFMPVMQLAVHCVLCLLADIQHSTRGGILIVNLVRYFTDINV